MISRLKKKVSPRDCLIRLDYSVLKNDATSRNFCDSVLESYNNQPPSNSQYTRLSDSVKATLSSTLPRKKKPSPGWFTAVEDKLIPLIERRNIAMSKHISRPLRSTAEKLKQARKAVKRTVVKAKNEWIFWKCSELNNASNTGTKVFWESVNQLGAGLCKTKASAVPSMKKPDGSLCKTPEENALVFQDHFNTLYGRQPIFDESSPYFNLKKKFAVLTTSPLMRRS